MPFDKDSERAGMQRLGDRELKKETEDDSTYDDDHLLIGRPLTESDIARDISPEYKEKAELLDTLRTEIKNLDRDIGVCQREAQWAKYDLENHLRAMSWAPRLLHASRLRVNREIVEQEARHISALAHQGELLTLKDRKSLEAGDAEREAAAALERVRAAAQVALQERQQRAALAREIMRGREEQRRHERQREARQRARTRKQRERDDYELER
ncbi:MAG: hypothetical protein ACREE4_03025 [Stellaceae bacterium]